MIKIISEARIGRLSTWLLTILALFIASFGHSQNQPNIIVILADDLGYGDVAINNPERGKIRTPNIDQLAREGMRFTDAHSSSAICSPSRYTILTGRYHWRSRLQKGIVEFWEEALIKPERITIAGLAQHQGYGTAAIGKWHLGWDWPITKDQRPHFTKYGTFEAQKDTQRVRRATPEDKAAWTAVFSQAIKGGPTAVGFDHYFGTDVPNWPPFCFILNDRTVGIPSEFLDSGLVNINQASFQGPALKNWRLEPILPAIISDAVTYISQEAKAKRPFLLYLPLTAPHTPIAISDEWKNKSGLHNDYADFVQETDAQVGRILEALEQNDIANNTLVIFTSDNGCGSYIGVKELEAQGHYPSGFLRGYKGDIWEGGHRIPFIVRLPGTVKAGSISDQLIVQSDIMATIAEIWGKKLKDTEGEDSFSFLPLLKGAKKGRRNSAIHCRHDGLQSIRKGKWKLICLEKPELYDLSTDIGEEKNVASLHPEIIRDLLSLRKTIIINGRSTPGVIQKNDVQVMQPY